MIPDPDDENPDGGDKPAGGESPAPEGEEQSEADMLAEWEAMAAEGEDGDEPGDGGGGGGGGAGDAAVGDVVGAALAGAHDGLAMHQVEVDAYAILGTSQMPVSQLLRMGRGAVVELDRRIGDKIELRINDLLVARGEIVVVEDRIAVEITEIVAKEG